MIRKVERVNDLVQLRTALVSVTDKTNLDKLIPELIVINSQIRIFTTGGTFTTIKKMVTAEQLARNIQEVSVYTGQPETEGGLVKTLHHKLFLGYLTEDYCPAHQNDLAREQAVEIDLVVINLYDFKKVVETPGADFEEIRGNIDVGGPSALRAAAKNFHRVMTASSPDHYQAIIRDLKDHRGSTCMQERFFAAQKTFKILSEYDRAISQHLQITNYEEVEACYEIYNRR